MNAFLRKYWLYLVIAAIFLWAVYQVEQGIAKIAAVALTLLFFAMQLPFFFVLGPLWAMGYAFGFGGPSTNWLYDWIPRNPNKIDANLSSTSK